jgi:radical SAM protein with 4Fe4S-binding SPASM domain
LLTQSSARDHRRGSSSAQLRNITISTTLTCNESCSHCWVSAGPRRSDDMTTAEIRRVLGEATELGAEHVKFTGGEPLSRSDLPELVEHAHALGFRVSIETNGLLLRQGLLASLSRKGASPHLYVSLDGAEADTHDRFRGKPGAFETTVANLREARKQGYYFSVHTMVRRQMIGELPALHDLVRELGASQHKLILTMQNLGRGRHIRAEAEASLEEMFTAIDSLPPQEFWDYGWDPAPSRETQLMTTLPPAFQPVGTPLVTCGWSQSFLAILADGSVALCHGLYDIDEGIAGNVRSDSLAEIWESSTLFRTTRSWSGDDLSGICGNCVVRHECRGLCRASAIGLYRDVAAPYPTCQRLFDAGLFPEHMIEDRTRDSSYVCKT